MVVSKSVERKTTENILCSTCEKNIAGGPKDISFEHKGLTFKIFKSDLECSACAKKKCIANFENNGKDLVSIEKGRPKINWLLYSEAHSNDQEKKMRDILFSIGIFSLEAEGNWCIFVDRPIGLNVRLNMLELYFTRKEDAIEFASLHFGRTLYQWEIRHTDQVLSKTQVLQEAKKARQGDEGQ